MKKKKTIIAVDIGGSKYITGLVSGTGEIISQTRVEWKPESGTHAVEMLCMSMDSLLDEASQLNLCIEAIGMSLPALTNPLKGIWLSSSIMGIYNLPIAKLIHDRYRLPVHVDNDCRACAIAEKWIGCCRDSTDFLYMTVSTGIGGGLFLNDHLYYGPFWSAGEIGLSVLEEDKRINPLGARDRVEVFAGSQGFVNTYLKLGGLQKIEGVTPNGANISDLADKGDPIALKAFEIEGTYLGKVIATAWNILGFEKVVLGGGLSLAFRHFISSLKASIEENSTQDPEQPLLVEHSPLGYYGAFLGAAALTIFTKESTYQTE